MIFCATLLVRAGGPVLRRRWRCVLVGVLAGGDVMGWGSACREALVMNPQLATGQQIHNIVLPQGHASQVHTAPLALLPGLAAAPALAGCQALEQQMQVLHGGLAVGNPRGLRVLEQMQMQGNSSPAAGRAPRVHTC